MPQRQSRLPRTTDRLRGSGPSYGGGGTDTRIKRLMGDLSPQGGYAKNMLSLVDTGPTLNDFMGMAQAQGGSMAQAHELFEADRARRSQEAQRSMQQFGMQAAGQRASLLDLLSQREMQRRQLALQEEQSSGPGLGGILGGIAGTALGTLAGGAGAAAGGALGARLGNSLFGGSGGSSSQYDYFGSGGGSQGTVQPDLRMY